MCLNVLTLRGDSGSSKQLLRFSRSRHRIACRNGRRLRGFNLCITALRARTTGGYRRRRGKAGAAAVVPGVDRLHERVGKCGLHCF